MDIWQLLGASQVLRTRCHRCCGQVTMDTAFVSKKWTVENRMEELRHRQLAAKDVNKLQEEEIKRAAKHAAVVAQAFKAGRKWGQTKGGEPKLLRPDLKQVGDSLGVATLAKNWITKTSLGSQRARFFCSDPTKPLKLLPDTEHPEINFAFPVTNVHVTLTDLGRIGDENAGGKVIWDADYATGGEKIKKIDSNMPSDAGSVRTMRPLCLPQDIPWHLELHVTADDPAPKNLKPPFEPPETDRGVDEIAQFEVGLRAEDDPRLHRPPTSVAKASRRRMLNWPRSGPYYEAAPCSPPETVLLLPTAFPTEMPKQLDKEPKANRRSFLFWHHNCPWVFRACAFTCNIATSQSPISAAALMAAFL